MSKTKQLAAICFQQTSSHPKVIVQQTGEEKIYTIAAKDIPPEEEMEMCGIILNEEDVFGKN